MSGTQGEYYDSRRPFWRESAAPYRWLFWQRSLTGDFSFSPLSQYITKKAERGHSLARARF